MRILVLGGSGLVGGVLTTHLAQRHEVTGTWSTRPAPGLVEVDLRDPEALGALARQHDLVINTAAVVDYTTCENDRELALSVNVAPLRGLVAALRGTETRILQISTDNVFDGTAAEYTESSARAPINFYGQSKALAEDEVLADPRHLVVRIPLMYGRSPHADRFMARFAKASTPAQTDIVCTPAYLPALATDIEQLWSLAGVVHYGGSEVMTRYELMSRLRDGLGLSTEIIPVTEAEMPPSAGRRPRNLVLRSERHALTGWPLDRAIADMAGSAT